MGSKGQVTIGRIVGVHGVNGVVRMLPFASPETFFAPDTVIRVRREGTAACSYEIRWARPHKRVLLVALSGLDTREEAEALVGGEIVADRSELPDLEEDAYYWHDVIGMDVVADDGRYLGRVASIIETGANDVFVVRNEDGEVLVPAIGSVVLSLDPEQRQMRVALPEGL